jgi:hypothetical protein
MVAGAWRQEKQRCSRNSRWSLGGQSGSWKFGAGYRGTRLRQDSEVTCVKLSKAHLCCWLDEGLWEWVRLETGDARSGEGFLQGPKEDRMTAKTYAMPMRRERGHSGSVLRRETGWKWVYVMEGRKLSRSLKMTGCQ